LLRERGPLARRLVAQFADNIPFFGQLPSEQLTNDIYATTDHNMVKLAEALRTRTVPTAADLAGPITASAARRAAEGMPLEAVTAAYCLGLTGFWRAVTADAGPGDLDDLMACTDIIFGYLRAALSAVSTAYLDERQRMVGHEHDSRHALLAALLRGEATDDPARRAGVSLPPSYLVLSLFIGQHPDEADPNINGAVATRRKLHRVQTELDHFTGERALSLLDTTGGTILIPAPAPARHNGHPPWSWDDLRTLADRMGRAASVDLWAAAAPATPPQVAAAARQTREVLDVTRAFDRPPGLYRLTDLLVEYQLTRPSAATDELKALLDPLDGHTDLLTTLQTHLQHGLNRRRTAAALHLHPNTIDYRLRKIIQLTGLDPGDPDHLQRIAAGLATRRLQCGKSQERDIRTSPPN